MSEKTSNPYVRNQPDAGKLVDRSNLKVIKTPWEAAKTGKASSNAARTIRGALQTKCARKEIGCKMVGL